MRFALFRRRQAIKVTSVAGVPIHGLEKNSDGVLLHFGTEDGKTLLVEIPHRVAGETRDYLRKVIEALDHWEHLARERQKSTPKVQPRKMMVGNVLYSHGGVVRWEDELVRGFDLY